MKKLNLFILVASLIAVLLTACGVHQQLKVYPHSKQFLHQARTAQFPSSKLLKAVPAIPGYDAVDTGSLPSNAQAVGCYAGPGIYNCSAAHQQAPNARLVSIAQQASVAAKCLDTEPGDAQPSQDLGWVRWMISRGQYRPCVYASLSEMSQVRSNLSSLPRSSYLLWVAAWDNNPNIPAGYDAIQWFGNTKCCYDRDTFGTWFFTPVPPPPPTCSVTMCYYHFINTVWMNPALGPCHRGCIERSYVQYWQGAQSKTHAYRVYIRYRIQALQHHLQWLINHSSSAINKRYNRYERAHILWAIGFKAAYRTNYNTYLKVT